MIETTCRVSRSLSEHSCTKLIVGIYVRSMNVIRETLRFMNTITETKIYVRSMNVIRETLSL